MINYCDISKINLSYIQSVLVIVKVFKAKLRDEEEVAVKVFKLSARIKSEVRSTISRSLGCTHVICREDA